MPKLSDRYYTGREVQRLLNISEPALRNLVNQRKLRKTTPPGRKTGVYLKEEVNAYAEKWFAFLTDQEPPKTTFEIAQLEDMEEVYALSQRAIAPVTMNANLRRSWLEKCPESCFVVKHNNKIVAFFHLLPVKYERLMEFMDGKIRGWEIKAEDIEVFISEKSVYCLAIIASEPDVNETTRMHYVRVLIRGMIRRMREIGKKGVIIKEIYATSETPSGIAMAHHAGMENYGAKIGKRLRFRMNPETSQSFLLQGYKEGLKEWKEKQTKPENRRAKKTVTSNT